MAPLAVTSSPASPSMLAKRYYYYDSFYHSGRWAVLGVFVGLFVLFLIFLLFAYVYPLASAR